MSKKFASLYQQQEIQGTKTLPAPRDDEYEKNFSTGPYKLPQQNFNVPPLRVTPVASNYEDGPTEKPKSIPLVANGVEKKAEKRKHEDEEDDVELTESEKGDEDDDASDDEEIEETQDDENTQAAQKAMLQESKNAVKNGNVKDAMLVHRIKENKRASRPDKLCDISGSGENGDDEDDDDDDEMEEDEDDSNVVERVRSVVTPVEHLLGDSTIGKIKQHLKRFDSSFAEFDAETIWALNAMVMNLLTVKFPHVALRLVCKTSESYCSKEENLRRVTELLRNDPTKIEVAKGFVGTQYYPLALAVKHGLPAATVVKPISNTQAICAIMFDPFGTAQMKAFAEAAIEQKIFPKTANMAPILMRRFAVYSGKNKQTAKMIVDESSMQAHESTVAEKLEAVTASSLSVAAETKKPTREAFVFDRWVDSEMVTFASDKTLLVNDVSDVIRASNVNMVVVPNEVLGALFRRRTEQRLSRLMLMAEAVEDDNKSFVSFLKKASLQRTTTLDNEIEMYVSTPTSIIKEKRDFVYAHLLFGFIRMNSNLTESEQTSAVGPCIVENLRVMMPNRIGAETSSGVHLSVNETPLRCLLRLNSNILKLLNKLWKDYHADMKIDGKSEFYEKRAVIWKDKHVQQATQYILSNDYASQKEQMLLWEKSQKKTMPDEFFVHDSLLYSIIVLLPNA